jgi:hypothetical protein
MSVSNGVLPVGLGTIVSSGSQPLWATDQPLAPGTLVFTTAGTTISDFSSAQTPFATEAVDFGVIEYQGKALPSGNYAIYSVLNNVNFSVFATMGGVVNWDLQLSTQGGGGQLMGAGSRYTNVGTAALSGNTNAGTNPVTGGATANVYWAQWQTAQAIIQVVKVQSAVFYLGPANVGQRLAVI